MYSIGTYLNCANCALACAANGYYNASVEDTYADVCLGGIKLNAFLRLHHPLLSDLHVYVGRYMYRYM